MATVGALLGLLATLALDAPGAAPLADRPPAPQPIYGGSVVPAGTWKEVVAIEVLESGYLCTGTLLADRLVVTAAHCLETATNPGKIRVSVGDTLPEATFRTYAASFGVHPDFCGDTETCKQDVHDFAWIRLVDPAPVQPANILLRQDEWDAAIAEGAPVTLVGYGEDEKHLQGVKRIAETTITAVSSTGQEFRAGGEGIDSCQGDSGGPAFVTVDGKVLLAGVVSRGYACGEGGFYGVPYTVLCWMSDESGIDIRPPDCATCDCLETAAKEGCGCRAPAPAPADPLALVVPFAAAWLGTRRRQR